jgi:hypothetical protein
VLEPVDQAMRGKKQQGSFMKRLNGGNEALKLFKVGIVYDVDGKREILTVIGVLHPHRVVLGTLSQDEIVCGVYKGL